MKGLTNRSVTGGHLRLQSKQPPRLNCAFLKFQMSSDLIGSNINIAYRSKKENYYGKSRHVEK